MQRLSVLGTAPPAKFKRQVRQPATSARATKSCRNCHLMPRVDRLLAGAVQRVARMSCVAATTERCCHDGNPLGQDFGAGLASVCSSPNALRFCSTPVAPLHIGLEWSNFRRSSAPVVLQLVCGLERHLLDVASSDERPHPALLIEALDLLQRARLDPRRKDALGLRLASV